MSGNIFRIGICDDIDEYIDQIRKICEKYFAQINVNASYRIFHDAEELISEDTEELDLLFLDIELPGVSGIDALCDIQVRRNIWRIVFVTSHEEHMGKAFGLKTLGFETKPVKEDRIIHYLEVAIRELKKNELLEFQGTAGRKRVFLSDLLYFEGSSNYTIIHTVDGIFKVRSTIKEIEKDFSELPLLRIHRSYVVNMMNVRNIHTELSFWHSTDVLPLGRKYKEDAEGKYLMYLMHYARGRL